MHELFLILHFIGLSMALGTGFANLFLGAVAAKLAPAERGSFMSKATVLVRMGQIGLGLLIISGLCLAMPHWGTYTAMPTFIAKLSLIVLLLITVTITSLKVRKAKKENDPSQLAKVKPLGMMNFFIGIAILILAVITFQ